MASLDALTRPDPVEASFEYGGEHVEIIFNRNALTQRWVKNLEADNDVLAVAKAFAEVLVSWNIEDANGPVPVTVDVLAGLPLPLLKAIDEAMTNSPTSEEGNGSGNTSSTPATGSSGTQESPRTSPSNSGSPTVSESIPGK